jgi:hypothetical protein
LGGAFWGGGGQGGAEVADVAKRRKAQ